MKNVYKKVTLFLCVVSLSSSVLGADVLDIDSLNAVSPDVVTPNSVELKDVVQEPCLETQVTTQKKNGTSKKVSTKNMTKKIVTQPVVIKDGPVVVSEPIKTSHSAKKDTQKAKADLPKGDLIDKIEVTIYGEEGVQIITKSDLERLSIDGQERTKEDIILERLMFLDAQKMHMVQGDEAVDAYLNNIQREHNMNKEQLEYLFANSGYSYEEAREQLRILYAVNAIVDFKIRSRLIVPEQDVVAYYKSHPVKLQPTYQIQRTVVPMPLDEAQQTTFKNDVEQWCQTGKGDIVPVWDEPFWIEKGDIAEAKKFITTMQIGACAVSSESDEGIELFKLADKKEERDQSIEERYREITDILRRPKYEELLAEYKKQLRESASIVYL